MKSRCFHGAIGPLAVALCVLVTAPAVARNYHISGGIQYVVQGGKERQKGNEEDARRIYGKAVAQLTIGIAESPSDLEAWDYLGVAYAELDSAEKAGWAFGQGIAEARKRPDEKKLLQRMIDNREHYWVRYFNNAIRAYQRAVDAAAPDGSADPALAEQAVGGMQRALAMNPENPKSHCNLAAFLANVKRYDEAIEVVEAGLARAPGDTCLTERKEQLGVVAAEKAAETGDWEKAAAPYERILAKNPEDVPAALRLGEIYFRQGQALEDEASKLADGPEKAAAQEKAKAVFGRSADGFGKYVAAKPEEKDQRFNYAIALVRAEKYQEAGRAAIAGLAADPAHPEFHQVLASAYRGLKTEDAAAGHTLVAKVLREGNKEADAAAFGKESAGKWGAASEAAALFKALGPPDEVRTQTMGEYPVECWFWWGPKRAVLFSKGRIVSEVAFAEMMSPPPPKPAPGKGGAGRKAAAPKSPAAEGQKR